MRARHAFSHACATIVSVLAGGLLLDLLRRDLPRLVAFFEDLAHVLIYYFELPYEPEYIATLIFAAVLAAAWGIAFAVAHGEHRRPTRRYEPPYREVPRFRPW